MVLLVGMVVFVCCKFVCVCYVFVMIVCVWMCFVYFALVLCFVSGIVTPCPIPTGRSQYDSSLPLIANRARSI